MRAIVAALVLAAGAVAHASERSAVLAITPDHGKLGDALSARITVTLQPGDAVDASAVPASWGKIEVLDGAWEPAAAGATTRVWSGRVAAYEIGALTIPELPVEVRTTAGPVAVSTAPVTVTIEGVIPKAEETPQEKPEIAGLKAPRSIPPDYGPAKRALAALAGLLVAAGIGWWLWRRYAARFAAASAPSDPFRKLPPHVWVYEELEKLLARRLAEEGKVGLFYDELTRIVKMYLEGRYRIELLDRTTSEVPPALQQAGAPQEAGRIARGLLETGDLVKFARSAAGPSECRASVEEAYRLVDMTKPAEVVAETTVPGAA